MRPYHLTQADHHTADELENAVATDSTAIISKILSNWPTQPHPISLDESNGTNSINAPYSRATWPFDFVLHAAIEQDNAEIVQLVLSYGFQVYPLAAIKPLERGSIDILQAFLDNGWDINRPLAEHMCPPLCYAITQPPLVSWFLTHGANPIASSPRNARTPISEACAFAPLSTIKLLFTHGATTTDCLHSAAESRVANRVEVMQYLLENGADVHAVKWQHHRDAFRTYMMFGLGTPLHHAARSGFLDRVDLLLSRGADVNALDSNGKTALEIAEDLGHYDVWMRLTNREPRGYRMDLYNKP